MPPDDKKKSSSSPSSSSSSSSSTTSSSSCGHRSAGPDSRSVLIHPGVPGQPVLSSPLFTKSPKIMESVWIRRCHEAPISPPAVVFLLYSSLLSSPLPPSFCKTLSPPISSSLFGSFHHPQPPPPTLSSDESLSLPAQAKCKRKLLCAADGKNTFKQRRSRRGTATTNRIFCEPACGDPFIMETAGRGTGGSVRFIGCGVCLQEGKFRKKDGKTRLRRL